MKHNDCIDCDQPMEKHKLVRINGRIEWSCPDDDAA